MKKIYTTEKYVKQVLETNINTRYSDNVLYLETIYLIRPELRGLDFKQIFLNSKKYRIPSFKTVERCRRMLEKKGEYRAPINIKLEREKMIQEYLNYAVSTGGGIGV